jgi:hypothetical protein
MPSIKVETHCHTAEVSPCGVLPAREMVEACHRAGYKTLVLTDHLWSDWRSELPMPERVQAFLSGYRIARETGDALNMKVLLGAELRLTPAPEDYLCYGLTEELLPEVMAFLDTHPSLSALHEYLNARDMLLVQAHPFRDGVQPMALEHLDGVEVYNANPRANNRNDQALRYALTRPGIIMTCGSDVHRVEDVGCGGLMAAEPIENNAQWLAFLRKCPQPRRIENGKIGE